MTGVMRTLRDRAYFATHEREQHEQQVAQAVRSSDQLDRTAAFDRASSPIRFAQRTSSGRPRGGTALRVGTVAPDRFASGRRTPTANTQGLKPLRFSFAGSWEVGAGRLKDAAPRSHLPPPPSPLPM